jgi:hypothetical protein
MAHVTQLATTCMNTECTRPAVLEVFDRDEQSKGRFCNFHGFFMEEQIQAFEDSHPRVVQHASVD